MYAYECMNMVYECVCKGVYLEKETHNSNDSYAHTHALIHTSHVHLVDSIDSSPHIHNCFLASKMKNCFQNAL